MVQCRSLRLLVLLQLCDVRDQGGLPGFFVFCVHISICVHTIVSSAYDGSGGASGGTRCSMVAALRFPARVVFAGSLMAG